MIDGDQWHYVRPNDASRYPRRIVCLDSESQRHLDAGIEHHTFLLGVASFDRIDSRTLESKQTEWIETDRPRELWEWVDGTTRKRERTVVFAHNLGYDLRITQALTILPTLGWNLRFVSLDGRRCYARFERGGASLSLSDSMSYFPASLDRIAQSLGMEKTPLPGIGENPDKYYDRCRRDVLILRRAMLDLLRWLESNDSGNFKPTGPAQAWTTYRHKFLRRRSLLVHRDEDALEAERIAAWTGRTEALRHGEYHYPLEEWDYRLAYATIATESDLPLRYLGSMILPGTPLRTAHRQGSQTLYECRVTTDVPTVPARVEKRIAWPTGTFDTYLWDCEAQLAIDHGGEVRATRCWRYLKAPFLREWGEWIIRQLTDDSLQTPELIRIMLKHWARCLIGRFGMRYPDWKHVGRSDAFDLLHFDCYDYDGGEDSQYLQLGNEWYACEGRRDGFDTAPAVMSYVMALQRVKVWHAIQAAGESDVFYLDTDSLLVTPSAGSRLNDLRSEWGHGNLIRKRQYESAEIYGPRVLVLDGEPRIAGLPRRAVATGKRNYKAQSWQTLGDSLKNGTPNVVRVSPRSFTVPTNDPRRQHLANGHTAPIQVTIPT